ncbi:MAG TPA: hypothetical protein ENN08_06780 [Bacteroidales bacterium]|nr:hypothetical protein [Bacteroidales bacterium]
MNVLTETLKYILPSALMLLAVYLVIQKFLQKENLRLEKERVIARQKEVFPVRMQAYERIILLLERISPSSLVLRVNKPGISLVQFQSLLIQTIRDEYDHNLSQQLYVSSRAWGLVRTAKEEMIRLINVAGGDIEKQAPTANLAGKILELHAGLDVDPIARALEAVKQEAREMF